MDQDFDIQLNNLLESVKPTFFLQQQWKDYVLSNFNDQKMAFQYFTIYKDLLLQTSKMFSWCDLQQWIDEYFKAFLNLKDIALTIKTIKENNITEEVSNQIIALFEKNFQDKPVELLKTDSDYKTKATKIFLETFYNFDTVVLANPDITTLITGLSSFVDAFVYFDKGAVFTYQKDAFIVKTDITSDQLEGMVEYVATKVDYYLRTPLLYQLILNGFFGEPVEYILSNEELIYIKQQTLLNQLNTLYSNSKIININNGHSFVLNGNDKYYDIFSGFVDTAQNTIDLNKIIEFSYNDKSGNKYSVRMMNIFWKAIFTELSQQRAQNKIKKNDIESLINRDGATLDFLDKIQISLPYPNGYSVDVTAKTIQIMKDLKDFLAITDPVAKQKLIDNGVIEYKQVHLQALLKTTAQSIVNLLKSYISNNEFTMAPELLLQIQNAVELGGIDNLLVNIQNGSITLTGQQMQGLTKASQNVSVVQFISCNDMLKI